MVTCLILLEKMLSCVLFLPRSPMSPFVIGSTAETYPACAGGFHGRLFRKDTLCTKRFSKNDETPPVDARVTYFPVLTGLVPANEPPQTFNPSDRELFSCPSEGGYNPTDK